MHNTEQKLEDFDKRLQAVEAKLKDLPTKADIGEVVKEAMIDALLKAGKWGKATLITVAVLIGTITVISGAFKAVLTFIGFSYIGK